MPNELPLDPQWQHLIEKRSEPDRRKATAANNAESAASDDGETNYSGPERRKQHRRSDDAR